MNLENNSTNNINSPNGQEGFMDTKNNKGDTMKNRLKARIYRALKNEVGLKMSTYKAEIFRKQILEYSDEVVSTNFGLDIYNDFSQATIKLGRNYYQVFISFDSTYRQTTFSFNKLDAESVEEGQEE